LKNSHSVYAPSFGRLYTFCTMPWPARQVFFISGCHIALL
jgi:hypothetical protein